MVTIDALSFGAGVALSGLAVFVFRALSRSPAPPSGKPHLIYFPIAGRGELSRLIAAAGGLEIKVGKRREQYREALVEESLVSTHDTIHPSAAAGCL